MAQIRQAAAAARFRLKAAHCGAIGSQATAGSSAINIEKLAPPKTTPRSQTLVKETPIISGGKFAPLALDSQQSSSMETN